MHNILQNNVLSDDDNDIHCIEHINSIAEGCEKLGNLLGLNKPVDPSVFIAAIRSEEYAHNLLVCRSNKAFLDKVLSSPPTFHQQSEIDLSNGDLLKSAFKALVKWGKTGFTIASDEIIKERLDACMKCEHLATGKPTTTVHNLLKTKARCGLCGCDIDKKIRLGNEICPGKSNKNPGYNFWGQKIAAV